MQTTAPRQGSRRGQMSRDAPSASMAIAGLSDPGGPRPMTVAAMRAAVIAIRAGKFDDVSDVDVVCGGPAPGAAVADTAGQAHRHRLPCTRADIGGPVVLAVAGHAGAGASTVAVAVAEGLAEGRRVQLVDYAEPIRSGLAAASALELGTDGGGWRRGRRGRLDVLRLIQHPADGDLPPLPEPDDAEGLVVDAGWPLTHALLDSPGSLVGGAMVVVVIRVTVPAVRQVEHVLA